MYDNFLNKMFKFSSKNLKLVSNVLKQTSGLLIQNNNCCGVIKLRCISTGISNFTDQTADKIKSPLGNLIAKDKDIRENQIKESSENEDEARKKREHAWRTMKITLSLFGISFTILGGYLIFTLGAPTTDPDQINLHHDIANKPVWQQYIIRTYRELDFYTRLIQEPSRQKLLPDPLQYPYLQPKYTLVLEITDVLVHPDWTYNTGWRFKKRPGLDYFLESLHGVYEIVVYTAEQGMTLFPLCEAIDPKNIIAYKLPRDTTYFSGGYHVKSLDRLNRDLSKVIAIDWQPQNLKFHPENLLAIKRWDGSDTDQTMIDLVAFLKSIAENEIEDVREVLTHYRAFDDPIEAFKEKRKMLLEQLEAEAAAKREQEASKVKRWRPSIFNKSF
ncbi:mitochondrial import inner membrane translocase subunit TIM50-C-like [Coccinella septempunctata]|uniref:mitochondrial import inner membrane translocase subunit TIM50-C-like n=1 Tax=Coccinella septempunctata TaxID=41139 RepID=UPI001D087A32|nr:mitochondrial import inner membrane translocase subunit TIM50-C-like [Coccinella septempunctata]